MSLTNLKQFKSELRAKYKKIRLNCPPDIKTKLDTNIFKAFTALEEYKTCKTLFLYVSSKIEVDTSKIMQKAFDDGKLVAVPKCTDKYGNMRFYYINSVEQLHKGCYGILEPDDNCTKAVADKHSLCIVPALCFDLYGYRIGFGKGYYDRFLADFCSTKVGICYSKCIERNLPVGNHDRPVDIIVTDKYVSRI